MSREGRFRLAVINSHPIQYFGPLYTRLAEEPTVDLTVYFCSRQGLDRYVDSGFGTEVEWDVPLLEGYRHKFLPNLARGGGVGGFFSLVNPAIISELWRERYDALLIHGHNYATYLMAIAAAQVVGTRVLMRSETHLLLSRSRVKQAIRRPVMRTFFKLCDAVLPIGSLNAEFYRHHGVGDDRMFRVPYAVDNAFFGREADRHRRRKDSVRVDLGLPAEVPLILFASKLIDRKRPLDLLRSYHQLRSEGLEATLVFVGSGPEEEALQAYVQANAVPDVHFMGFRNQSELPKFYGISDVFVLPSVDEPWGLIVNEVMAAGCPVVVGDQVGAAADLVTEGVTGFAIPAGDVRVLTERLKRLMLEPNLREEMGENARRRMETWGFEQCVAGIRAALEAEPAGGSAIHK